MRLKKSVMIMLFLLTAAFAVSGCGNNADTQESTAASGTTEQKNDANSPENMTGTEDKVGKDTVGDAADDVGDAAKDIADGAGDAAKDIVEGAGEAADDVADGVGDAIVIWAAVPLTVMMMQKPTFLKNLRRTIPVQIMKSEMK